MKHTSLPLLVLLCTFQFTTFSSCEKDEIDKLPEITSEGLNTFGCLINGEAFVPKRTALQHYLNCIYYKDSNRINIYVGNDDSIIDIWIYQVRLGENKLLYDETNSNLAKTMLLYLSETQCSDDNQKIDTLYSSVNVSFFDTENQIISGTFNIEIACDSMSNTLGSGRFDLDFTIN